MDRIKTPCIGLCSTVYGDIVCRGCKRYDFEIIAWNGYAEGQKLAVMQRLDTLLAQIMRDRCEVVDVDRLMASAQALRIHGCSSAFIHHCAYQIIGRGASIIRNIEEHGIRVLPAGAGLQLTELRDVLDQTFFERSEHALQADRRRQASDRLSHT